MYITVISLALDKFSVYIYTPSLYLVNEMLTNSELGLQLIS